MKKTKGLETFDPSAIVTKLREAILHDVRSPIHAFKGPIDPRVVDIGVRQYEQALTKKFVDPRRKANLQKAAFEGFLDRCSDVRSANSRLRALRRDPGINRQAHKALDRARCLVSWVLGPFIFEEFASETRFSNGSSLGVPYSEVSVTRKLTAPVSCTTRTMDLFQKYLKWDSTLSSAIGQVGAGYFEVVPTSRATTVPKDSSKDRMIAVEPTLCTFFQQGLMKMLYSRLEKVGLDVGTLQHEHRIKAMEASVTCLQATIDFSNASDMVSMELVKWIFPHDWFNALCFVRTDRMSVSDIEVDLPMIGTMGNATTFPVETLVFWSLGVASAMVRSEYLGTMDSNPLRMLSQVWERNCVSVFGDDVILPSAIASSYIELCEWLGLVVNKGKSYFGLEGFRESCGGDYFHMRNVRPLYLRGPASDRVSSLGPWLSIIYNELRDKYIQYFGDLKWCYQREALKELCSIAREYHLLIPVVPSSFPSDAGFHDTDILRVMSCYDIAIRPTYSFYREPTPLKEGGNSARQKRKTIPNLMLRAYYVGATNVYRFQFKYKKPGYTHDGIRLWDSLRGFSKIDRDIDQTRVSLRHTSLGFGDLKISGTDSSVSMLRKDGGYFVACSPSYLLS